MSEPFLEQSNNSNDDWSDCPAGKVGQLVQALQKRRRVRAIRQTASGVATVALLVVAGFYVKMSIPSAQADYGGISCTKVKELGSEFISDKLDNETSEQVKEHLADCEACEQFLKELMKKSESRPDDAGANRIPDSRLEQSVVHRKQPALPVIIAAGL